MLFNGVGKLESLGHYFLHYQLQHFSICGMERTAFSIAFKTSTVGTYLQQTLNVPGGEIERWLILLQTFLVAFIGAIAFYHWFKLFYVATICFLFILRLFVLDAAET
jgi:hypothetical protein